MRKALRTAQEDVIRRARTFVDLFDGMEPGWHAKEWTAWRELSKAFDRLDGLDVPEITGAGHAANADAPYTAHEAASLARITQCSTRRRIVEQILLAPPGLCDFQLERRLKQGRGDNARSTVSSARNWLTDNGWLVDSGKCRLTPARRKAIVWALTPAARAALLGQRDQQQGASA